MKLIEDIDSLLTEGRLWDVDFDDLFGPPGRKLPSYNGLDKWMDQNSEMFTWEMSQELELRDFKPEEIRATEDFKNWVSEERFGDEWGYEEDLGPDDDWNELYEMWLKSGWDGFDYNGFHFDSAVEEFSDRGFDEVDGLTDTDTAMEWIRMWANNEFSDIVGELGYYAISSQDNRVHIYRAMRVKKDWLEHLAGRGRRLGVYWSYKESKAEAHWGDFSKPNEAIIKTSVKEEHVNWVDTILLNMDPSTGDLEKEIRLFKNTPIKIERLWMNKEEVELPQEIKNKTFKA